jgi:hypothetical protein
MVLGANNSSAIPVTYYWFSDVALYNDSGSGSFTLDIDNPLGIYRSTEVAGGGGDKTGTWTAVQFSAQCYFLPTLTIYGTRGPQSYSFMALSGAGVDPNSTATAEWNHFITQAALNRITITAEPTDTTPFSNPVTNGVPEGTLPATLSALLLAGICLTHRIIRH